MQSKGLSALLIGLLILAAGPARSQPVSLNDQLKSADLSPSGTLRVAFLGTNPIQGRVNAETGEITGPVADITAELAMRLGVPYELIPHSGAQPVIDGVNSGRADLGFLA